jgi:hypothetical protein
MAVGLHLVSGASLFAVFHFLGPLVSCFTLLWIYLLTKKVSDWEIAILSTAVIGWAGKHTYLGFQLLERGIQTMNQEFALLILAILLYLCIVDNYKPRTFNTIIITSFHCLRFVSFPIIKPRMQADASAPTTVG